MIYIVTGSRGVGKTTYILKLIEELKNRGKHPSGIITPAIYDAADNKVGFYALNVADGEQWELGRSDKLLNGPSYGPFSFSKKGFNIANKILEKELTEGSSDIFIDEIGPLELREGYGFFSILSYVSRFSPVRNLYLVIRQSLIDKFASRFLRGKKYKVIEITMENRNRIQSVFRMY